jgi:hypothetical protein
MTVFGTTKTHRCLPIDETKFNSRYGLKPVKFPSSPEQNQLAPVLENRFKDHAGGYAPVQRANARQRINPTDWFEIRPSWEKK